MLEMAEGLRESLEALREEIHSTSLDRVRFDELRALIIENDIGSFLTLNKMEQTEIADYLSGKTIAGVDGSTTTFGGLYPGTVTLLQAGAMTMSRKKVLLGDCLSPLSQKVQIQIQNYRNRYGLSEEEAFSRYKDERLVSLEIQTAIQLLQTDVEPALMMFDGGFVRYESKAGKWWEEYQQVAENKRVLSVGIIEEVGTNFISKALKDITAFSLPYDRHALFGVLKKGEALILNPAKMQKGYSGNYYTCFARLSSHPSVIGCDLFHFDQNQLKPLLNYLYTNTLETSRGVPFWIDRVDHEIKLSYRETEAILRQALPASWVEQYLVSQRSRRNL